MEDHVRQDHVRQDHVRQNHARHQKDETIKIAKEQSKESQKRIDYVDSLLKKRKLGQVYYFDATRKGGMVATIRITPTPLYKKKTPYSCDNLNGK